MLEPALVPATAPRFDDAALRSAILRTLLYADIFDCPLTPDELSRYLIGQTESTLAVTVALDADDVLCREVERSAGFVYLAGRGDIVPARLERASASARLWPRARHYGAMIARLPFVRMVAVTGALSMNNARPDDDIDLFVLAQPGRLWLARLFVIAVVKLAARRGIELCPNFVLSTDHLTLARRNLYSAHEVAQLVPLSGRQWHRAFLEANGWVSRVLPNAIPAAQSLTVNGHAPWLQKLAGGVLALPLFDPLEAWEMRRKIKRLKARLERDGGTVALSAHECRGHFAGHDARILAAYDARLAAYHEVLE